MLPSVASRLVQVTPPPVTVNVPPEETSLLNKVNLSPATRAGPRLVTVMVPVPALFNVPLTDTMSFDCARDLLSLNNPSPRVRLLLMINVPMAEVPGAIAPGEVTVTAPRTVPVPPSEPLVTVTPPTSIWPFTQKFPALTNVGPV